MTTWIAVLWFVGIWGLVILGVGFVATIPLMRRRDPDPLDHPWAHQMPCVEISFPSRDGVTLGGFWIPARGTARGTIILCSGQNGSLDKDIPQAVPLHQAGFNTLMFDFRAHGRSEGSVVTLGAFEQADLFGALDYAQSQQDANRVGVLGFSMGASVALMVAAQDERVAALAVDGAYPRLSGLLANWLRIQGVPFLAARPLAWLALIIGALRTQHSIYRANPADFAARVRAPTLFIHGDLDPFLTQGEIEALVALVPAHTELWRVADAGHRGAHKVRAGEYVTRVVKWFEDHLAAEKNDD